MRKRLKTISGAAAALAILALGGSAIASGTQHTRSASKQRAISTSLATEKTSAPDTDNIQSGDQTSPDTHSAKASSVSTASQTPDSGSATENSSETPDTGSAAEVSSESDGPGGHEDPAGNVDHQSEGQE
ncbi:MAG TPA: hypothetical protein VGY76_11090 [Solirubrobacteraceae bacterium]|nr:hypothetical protein [Solirubrobacteraceae bacterium]